MFFELATTRFLPDFQTQASRISPFRTELSEYASEKDKKAAINVVNDIIESDARAIVCGHNPVIPGIVAKFIGKKNFKELDHGLLPGEAWILHHKDGEVVAIDWVQAPVV